MRKKEFFELFTLGVLLIGAYALMMNLSYIKETAVKIFSAFLPIITGFLLAFFNNILLKKFERKIRNRRLCLLLTVSAVTAFIAVFVFLILPEIKNAIRELMENIPFFIEKINRFTENVNKKTGLDLQRLVYPITKGAGEINGVKNAVTGIVTLFANLGIGFVLSLYILMNKETVQRTALKISRKVLKERSGKAERLCTVSSIVFESFITGQLLEALILGGLCFLGMAVLRIPYAVMVSSIVGIMALIPVFGGIFGAAAGFLLILSVNPTKAWWFLIFLIILQQVEGNFIYPKVVGRSVGLPPAIVLCAVIVGGGFFGIAGILLGVPVVSVVYFCICDKNA